MPTMNDKTILVVVRALKLLILCILNHLSNIHSAQSSVNLQNIIWHFPAEPIVDIMKYFRHLHNRRTCLDCEKKIVCYFFPNIGRNQGGSSFGDRRCVCMCVVQIILKEKKQKKLPTMSTLTPCLWLPDEILEEYFSNQASHRLVCKQWRSCIKLPSISLNIVPKYTRKLPIPTKAFGYPHINTDDIHFFQHVLRMTKKVIVDIRLEDLSAVNPLDGQEVVENVAKLILYIFKYCGSSIIGQLKIRRCSIKIKDLTSGLQTWQTSVFDNFQIFSPIMKHFRGFIVSQSKVKLDFIHNIHNDDMENGINTYYQSLLDLKHNITRVTLVYNSKYHDKVVEILRYHTTLEYVDIIFIRDTAPTQFSMHWNNTFDNLFNALKSLKLLHKLSLRNFYTYYKVQNIIPVNQMMPRLPRQYLYQHPNIVLETAMTNALIHFLNDNISLRHLKLQSYPKFTALPGFAFAPENMKLLSIFYVKLIPFISRTSLRKLSFKNMDILPDDIFVLLNTHIDPSTAFKMFWNMNQQKPCFLRNHLSYLSIKEKNNILNFDDMHKEFNNFSWFTECDNLRTLKYSNRYLDWESFNLFQSLRGKKYEGKLFTSLEKLEITYYSNMSTKNLIFLANLVLALKNMRRFVCVKSIATPDFCLTSKDHLWCTDFLIFYISLMQLARLQKQSYNLPYFRFTPKSNKFIQTYKSEIEAINGNISPPNLRQPKLSLACIQFLYDQCFHSLK